MATMFMGTKEVIRNFDSEQKRISGKPVRDISEGELSSLEFLAHCASNSLAGEGMGYLASSLLASARNLIDDIRAVRLGALPFTKVRRIRDDFLPAYTRLL